MVCKLLIVAVGGIKRKVELNHFTEDDYYLKIVNTNIEGALNEFKPDVIVYNAGTDVLDGDPLGCLSISPEVNSQTPFVLLNYTLSKEFKGDQTPV